MGYIAKNQIERPFLGDKSMSHPLVTLTSENAIPTATNTYRLAKGDPMKDAQISQTPYSVHEYLEVFAKTAKDFFHGRKTHQGHEVGDIVSFAVLDTCEKLKSIMESNPDPQRFANTAIRNLANDYGRRQAAQSGQGARYTRKVVDGETPSGAYTIERICGAMADSLEDSVDVCMTVWSSIKDISIMKQRVLQMCVVEGRPDREVARILGVRREHVNRLKNEALISARRAMGPAS